MVDDDVDILIVGGGLIGAMLVLALASTGIRCLLVDTHDPSARLNVDFDSRSIALSAASVRIFNMLNIWQIIQEDTTAIDTIHISEQRRFGSAILQANLDESLGYVVELSTIHKALAQSLKRSDILAPATVTGFDPTSRITTIDTVSGEKKIRAKLIVAADGANSCMRRFCGMRCEIKDYPHVALVANVGIARHHQYTAYERFTPTGPLALLPMNDLRMALVWSLLPEDAERLAHTSDKSFLHALQLAFGYRLGRFVKVGQRMTYPLRQVYMPQLVKDTVVFIGNAAHTLHPVAGQGFNLGLRDVAMLAQCVTQHGLSKEMLNHYQQARYHDQSAITRFTDSLVELFTNQHPGLVLARTVGLMTLDNSVLLKTMISRYARGFAGVIPDLVCEIPLKEI